MSSVRVDLAALHLEVLNRRPQFIQLRVLAESTGKVFTGKSPLSTAS